VERYDGVVIDVTYDPENPRSGFGVIYSPITSSEYKFYQDELPDDTLLASVVAGDKVIFTPSQSSRQKRAIQIELSDRMLVCYQTVPDFVITEKAYFAGTIPLIKECVRLPSADGKEFEGLKKFAQKCGFNGILKAETLAKGGEIFSMGEIAILAKPFPLHLASGPYIRYDLMERYLNRCQSKFDRFSVELGIQSQ
jgi:hypothetical protein